MVGDRNLQVGESGLTERYKPKISSARALLPICREIASVPIKTRAAPIWVFCMPAGPGGQGSLPELESAGGLMVDPRRAPGDPAPGGWFGVTWRPEAPLAAA